MAREYLQACFKHPKKNNNIEYANHHLIRVINHNMKLFLI